MSHRLFSPSDVEDFTDWTAVGLRDLRAKGYLADYGVLGENGRWKYRPRDVVAFWIAARLQDGMRIEGAVNLRTAFNLARDGAETVIAIRQGHPQVMRYSAVLLNTAEPGQAGGASLYRFADLGFLATHVFHKADIYDWHTFANTAPDCIKATIEAAD